MPLFVFGLDFADDAWHIVERHDSFDGDFAACGKELIVKQMRPADSWRALRGVRGDPCSECLEEMPSARDHAMSARVIAGSG